MFAPTACTTPTRLPTLVWSLAVALLLLGAFAPVFASETDIVDRNAAASLDAGPLQVGGWRVLPLDQMMRTALLRRAYAAPSRLMPLAVLPSQHSAWWLGVSVNRTAGA